MTPLAQADNKFNDAISHFETELKKLRAGRPTPDMFAGIKVEAYGGQMTMESVGSINIVDASLVTIQPWDKTLISEIDKAIKASNLGLNPQIDGDLIRLPIPPLTQEKRQDMVKIVKQAAENCRIQIRVIRKDVMDHIDHEQKEGLISEDQKKANEKQLQDKVDAANKKVEELVAAKESALMTV